MDAISARSSSEVAMEVLAEDWPITKFDVLLAGGALLEDMLLLGQTAEEVSGDHHRTEGDARRLVEIFRAAANAMDGSVLDLPADEIF